MNRIYDAAEKDKKMLEIATMQAEVQAFWRSVKENRELTWGKGNKDGGKDTPGGGNQGGGGQGEKSNGGNGGRKGNRNKNKGKEDKDNKEETIAGAGVQENNVKYCFKCGDPQHFARDCKKPDPFSCAIHQSATSHDSLACYIWRKANNMPVAQRPPSKDRKKDGPPGAQGDGTGSGAGTQNFVSAELIDPVDEREIYSDESDEDMVGGAYGGYTAELMDGDIPVNS